VGTHCVPSGAQVVHALFCGQAMGVPPQAPDPLQESLAVAGSWSSHGLPAGLRTTVQSLPLGVEDASHTPGVQVKAVPRQIPVPSQVSSEVARSPSSQPSVAGFGAWEQVADARQLSWVQALPSSQWRSV
jgi:hypothetical protein